MSSTFLLRKRILINVYLLESCNSVLWHRNLASLVNFCNEGRLSEDLQFGSDNSFFFYFILFYFLQPNSNQMFKN